MDLEEQAAHIEAVEAVHIEAVEAAHIKAAAAVDSAVLVEPAVEALHIEQGRLLKGILTNFLEGHGTPSVIIFLCTNSKA